MSTVSIYLLQTWSKLEVTHSIHTNAARRYVYLVVEVACVQHTIYMQNTHWLMLALHAPSLDLLLC